LPLPDESDLIESQSAFAVAVQLHPLPAVTVIVPSFLSLSIATVVGVTKNVQATPSCVTVNVRPAMEIVPLRAAPLLTAALKVIDPLPLPDAALVIVSQLALLTAVHAQPLPADTVIVPVPPPAGTDWPDGLIE
jgi:hypothetical protein